MWKHKSAEVYAGARVGRGTYVWNHGVIHGGARIGENCTIGHNCMVFGKAVIGNGCKLESNIDVWSGVTIGDNVFIGPSVCFTNDFTPRAESPKRLRIQTRIDSGVSIGANATILCGIHIGEYAAIGAGSVVLRDVAPYTLVAGNPAQFIRNVCSCNQWGNPYPDGTGDDGLVCPSCGKRYSYEGGRIVPQD